MIVEDDSTIREELSNLLSCNGYEVEAITNFAKTVTRINEYMPHLILLDINLPGDDGFSICTKIRSFLNVPIVFVTSRNTDMDELNSIMLGGDAFIIKPYNVAILLAKIYSLLQRYHPNENKEILTYQSVILHLESSKIEFEGKKTDLTKNELKILYYLFKHGGKICPRIDIVEYLWDNQMYVDDNALSVNVTRIREKLSSIGLSDFIKTKHRQGYMI